MARTILRPILQAARFIGLVSIVFAFAETPALSQSNPFDTGTPAESRSGLISHSSYAQDKIETVNLATGNLSVNIPLVTIGGRGSASYTVALSYNSKLWTGQSFKDINDDFHSGTSFDDGLNSSPNRIAIGCGWFISKGPVIKTKIVNIDRIVSGQGAGNYFYVLTRVWLVLPDGSEVELRDNATDGQPGATAPPMHLPIDRDRGRVWHSTDGSAITYVTDADNGVVNNQLAGYVYLADGTRLKTRPGGSCSDIIDRNGNYLHIDYNAPVSGAVTYTDDLGRQVILQGGSGGATVTINGYNGVAPRVINIVTDQIVGASNNLRSDFQLLSTPIISGDYANGIEHFVFGNNPHTDVFFHSDMAATNVGGVGGYIRIDTQTPVTRLDLLDGRNFRFRYNQFGELAEIVYPGGGVSRIDHVALGSTLCEGWTELNPQLNRGVSQRRSLTDGTNTDATWEYIRGTGTVGATNYPTVRLKVHQGGIAGATLMDETHYFMALNAQYLVCGTRISNGTGYDTFENNREFRVERQTGSGTDVVSRVWAQRAAVVWQPGYPTQQPPNDPRVTQEDTIIETGKMKRIDYTYDPFNNATLIKEYNWGTSGNPGALARQTERTYVTNLNGYCYTNLNGVDNGCGSLVPTNSAKVIHKRRLVLNETIRDGSLNVEAYAEHEYDNYIDDGINHAPLVSNLGMFQYDGTWFGPFAVQNQPRGNATRTKRLISGQISGGNYTEAYAQYDEAGHVVKTIVPNGSITNTATISYADDFGDGSSPGNHQFVPSNPTFALPTVVTNALGQQAKTQYDYTRGAVSGAKDANGTVTKTEQFDMYDRPLVVKAAYNLPEETRTEMSYPSVSANESKVSRQLDSTRWLSSRAQYDGFGRTTLASEAEDGAHFNSASFTIHSKTLYDGLSRAVKVTNPYRSGADATDGWTRTAFDVAGRVIDVATFSGSPTTPPPEYPATIGTGVSWTGSVATTYNGDQTTVADQAGKKRRGTMNSLGQLVQVDELNDDGSLYAATNYSYDARGNLLTTTQAAGAITQTRRFAYDALSRLLFAVNPEQNTSSNSVFTYNGQQWAVKYIYDVASNLTDKTDTRPVGAQFVNVHYNYDVLNRVTQRSYNDGTPQVNYVYDTATNGVGRLRSVTASGVSTYNYTIYDALGRPTAYNQATEGQTYSMSCTYNKAAMPVDETYPSNKVMHTEYDAAGRPAGVKKATNSFYYAGAVATDATNRVQYAAHGVMSVIKLGNGLWEHENFNSRLQPMQIGLGTSQSGQNSSSVLGLDYTYGVLISGSLMRRRTTAIFRARRSTPRER